MIRNCSLILLLLALVGGCLQISAAEQRVSSAAAITEAIGRLRPGDTVVMANGEWKDQAISFYGQGTAEKPITLRAETLGQVELSGHSSVTVTGQHLVVCGICLKDGRGSSNGIFIGGQHCRLTETAMIGGTYKFFVHLAGSENRMDHCYLAGKTSESPTLQIEVENQPNHHRIDHNYFGPRPPLGRNGGETMRVGYSWQSMSNSATVVEENLFERCDGEIEIISNKSCGNVYRNNTFLDCAGMLTLRHGNRCLVENNYFLAHHKRGSGGIRVIGEDHRIINNYIDGVAQGGIWITAGISNSPLKGYFQARNILIASNTIVDSRGPCLDLNAGFGSSGRTLRPEKVTIANNYFAVPDEGVLVQGTEGARFKWSGNVATAQGQGAAALTPVVLKQTGVKLVAAKPAQRADGLWQPTATLSGKRFKAGCDLIANGSPSKRPLTAAEVGPLWLTNGERSR
jgi:poly(beta-D-mannuronate) lyase